MAATDIGARLQHPRRSLGNRHRSQANKFLKLAESDKNNLPWQNKVLDKQSYTTSLTLIIGARCLKSNKHWKIVQVYALC